MNTSATVLQSASNAPRLGTCATAGGGLMSAADEARDRGMEPEDIAARRWKGGGALRVALSAVKQEKR